MSSLRNTWRRWNATVCVLMNIWSAIRWLVRPSATRRAVACSLVRLAQPAAGLATRPVQAPHPELAQPSAGTRHAPARPEPVVLPESLLQAADRLAERERVLSARTRAAAAAIGLGRAACALAGGAGLAGVARRGGAASRADRPCRARRPGLPGPGVAAVFQGLPDAVGRLPVSRASLTRLAILGSLPRLCLARHAAPVPPLARLVRPALSGPGPPPSPCAGRPRPPNRPGPVIRDLDLELALAGWSRSPDREARARRSRSWPCCAFSTSPQQSEH